MKVVSSHAGRKWRNVLCCPGGPTLPSLAPQTLVVPVAASSEDQCLFHRRRGRPALQRETLTVHCLSDVRPRGRPVSVATCCSLCITVTWRCVAEQQQATHPTASTNRTGPAPHRTVVTVRLEVPPARAAAPPPGRTRRGDGRTPAAAVTAPAAAGPCTAPPRVLPLPDSCTILSAFRVPSRGGGGGGGAEAVLATSLTRTVALGTTSACVYSACAASRRPRVQ